MHVSIYITKQELLAGMAYHAEIERISKTITEGLCQKFESEPKKEGFSLPTFSQTEETKAFRASASLGLNGMDIKLDVEPQFITEILELYAKFANKIAIPIAQFVMAMVMSVSDFEGDVKQLAQKWIKEGKQETTEN